MEIAKGRIRAKTIRTKVKEHWTVSDFMTNYEISEEKFMNLIDELFHGAAKDIKRDLKKNESQKKPSSSNKSVNSINEGTQMPEEQAQPIESHKEEPIVAVEASDESELDEERNAQEQAKWQKLIVEEQEKAGNIRQNIISLEIEHDRLIARKRVIQTKELQELKAVLEQYRAKIQAAQDQFDGAKKELAEILGRVDDVKGAIAENKEQLKVLEEEIRALSTVDVFVYTSGEIEVSACTEIKIPEDNEVDWISIVNNNTQQCKKMTIAQIQSVAKVIYVVRELKSWQTVFENEECRVLFDNLMAKQSQ